MGEIIAAGKNQSREAEIFDQRFRIREGIGKRERTDSTSIEKREPGLVEQVGAIASRACRQDALANRKKRLFRVRCHQRYPSPGARFRTTRAGLP